MFQHIENYFQQIENYFGNLIFKIYQILIYERTEVVKILKMEKNCWVPREEILFANRPAGGYVWLVGILIYIFENLSYFLCDPRLKKTTNKSQLVNVGLVLQVVGLLLQIRKLNNSKFIGHSYSHSLSHSYITKV